MIHQGETLGIILKNRKIKLADFTDKMQWKSPKYVHQFLAKAKFTDEQLDKICEAIGEDVRDQILTRESTKGTVPIDAKDETIASLKELNDNLKARIKDKDEIIIMLKEKIKSPSVTPNVQVALEEIEKQFPLMMQKIELVQQQVAKIRV